MWKLNSRSLDKRLPDLKDSLSQGQTILGEDFDSEAAFAERAGADGNGAGRKFVEGFDETGDCIVGYQGMFQIGSVTVSRFL